MKKSMSGFLIPFFCAVTLNVAHAKKPIWVCAAVCSMAELDRFYGQANDVTSEAVVGTGRSMAEALEQMSATCKERVVESNVDVFLNSRLRTTGGVLAFPSPSGDTIYGSIRPHVVLNQTMFRPSSNCHEVSASR